MWNAIIATLGAMLLTLLQTACQTSLPNPSTGNSQGPQRGKEAVSTITRVESQNPKQGRHFAFVKFANGPTRQLEFIPINGLAVFEGDIVLGDAPTLNEKFGGSQSAADKEKSALVINGSKYRWPGFSIPYSIDSGVSGSQVAEIQAAVTTWNQLLSSRGLDHDAWVARKNDLAFVTFVSQASGDCDSEIGRQGRQQFIRLASGCLRGQIEHEMGHAMGLWHEQSRFDRDSYVRINLKNVQQGKESNFDQHVSDGGVQFEVNAVPNTHVIYPYDYDSIMHYGAYDFAIDPTIPTIESPQPIGQRRAPSYLDVEGVWANQYKAGWGVRICDGTHASTIKFNIGYVQNNTRRSRYWFKWTAGERREFETPGDVRYKQKLWISAEGDPHDQINMCIVYNGEPAQGMTFSADESKEVGQDERTDDCRCQ